MSLSPGTKSATLTSGCNTVRTFLALRVWPTLTSSDAFDVIGELTFSQPLGFLEKGADIDGIIGALEKMLDYSGKVRCLKSRVV